MFDCAITVISILLLICFFNQVLLATKMISAAAEFVNDVPTIIFVPIVMIIVSLAFVIAWLFVLAYLLSLGDMEHSKSLPFMKINLSQNEKYVFYGHLFGLLWGLAFL